MNITSEQLISISFDTSFIVFPTDTNSNDPPCVFGGKMLAEMDSCAAIVCRRALYGTECDDCVTVNSQVEFHRPAFTGDIVHIHGVISKVGHKSLTVSLDCTREEKKTGKKESMASGVFVFVARKNGIPSNHDIIVV